MTGEAVARATTGSTFVHDVASLAVVQPEGTLSRTVLRADGVRLVLFAFDAGQVLTEHTAAMPVLLQVLDGSLQVTAEGRDHELAPGGVLHLAPRVPHSVTALEQSHLLLTMIDARGKQHAAEPVPTDPAH